MIRKGRGGTPVPYCDYELLPRTPWKYALASGELEAEEREGEPFPFLPAIPAAPCALSWSPSPGILRTASTACAPSGRNPLSRWGNRFPFPYFHTAAPSYG